MKDIIILVIIYLIYKFIVSVDVNCKNPNDVDFDLLEADKQRNNLSNSEVQRNYAYGKYDKDKR